MSEPRTRPTGASVEDFLAAVPDAQVVGCGGIGTTADVRSFLAAGATAVQVGTALLHDPSTATRLVADLATDTGSEPRTDAQIDHQTDPSTRPQGDDQ